MPTNFNFSYQNVIDGQGVLISITGMTIVFLALSFISFFIFLLPKILEATAKAEPAKAAAAKAAKQGPADEEISAAIGYALHSLARAVPGK